MKIAIYGMGRFGRFWAGLFSGRFEVGGFSRSLSEYPDGVERISEDELREYDTIFLCCSISSVEEVLGRIGGKLKKGAVVIDTCSVKVEPNRLMKELLPGDCSIIGTHPMFGPDSGRHGVEGLPLVFCSLGNRNGCDLFWLDEFAKMGLKIIEMTPDQHDSEAAFTQGITHFIGRVLKQLNLEDSEIATLGYQKLQDIVEQTCNDPLQLFLDLQKYNHHTEEMRIKLQRALNDTMKLF